MAKHAVYSIGRSRDADIQLSDSTISRNHAELVITAAGKYYLIDCASSGGTFVVKGNEKTAIKQAFVSQTDNLSFGEFHTSLQHGRGNNLTYLEEKPVLVPTELTERSRLSIGETQLLFIPLCGEGFDWQDVSAYKSNGEV